MNEKIEALKSSFDSELKKIANMVDLEALRVNYLGRKGKVTDALKGMGGLTDEQKKTVGRNSGRITRLRWCSASASRCSSRWASRWRITPRW